MNTKAWNIAKQIADSTMDGQNFTELVDGGIELIKEKEGEYD